MAMTITKVAKAYEGTVAHLLKDAGIPTHPYHVLKSRRTELGGFSIDTDLSHENCVLVRWTTGRSVPDGEATQQERNQRLEECSRVLMGHGCWVSNPHGHVLYVVGLEWLS
ncbi:hypothetical protein ACFWAP_00825 [Streptomyces goshikiensis]|uniref:hypothetical protein n=1 Tax=Streptomyces goshikiensis TaxID=1942 RepID=UPI0036629B5D